MGYPSNYIKFEMIHWEPENPDLPDEFDYIRKLSVALTRMSSKVSYQFDVRCRLRVHDLSDKEVFSSLLEVVLLYGITNFPNRF